MRKVWSKFYLQLKDACSQILLSFLSIVRAYWQCQPTLFCLWISKTNIKLTLYYTFKTLWLITWMLFVFEGITLESPTLGILRYLTGNGFYSLLFVKFLIFFLPWGPRLQSRAEPYFAFSVAQLQEVGEAALLSQGFFFFFSKGKLSRIHTVFYIFTNSVVSTHF